MLLLAFGVVASRQVLRTDEHASAPLVEMAHLRRLTPFAAMSAPELETVARTARFRDLDHRDMVRLADLAQQECCLVLTSGRFEIRVQGRPTTVVDADGEPGDDALVHGVFQPATVQALATGTVMVVSSAAFVLAATQEPAAASSAVQGRPQRGQALRSHPEPGPLAALFPVHEAGGHQDRQVVRHRRL